MPFVEIKLAEGRDPKTLRACLAAVHNAVRDSLGVEDQAVRVHITEFKPELWSAGGVTMAERRAQSL
ncbi:4-oxalocrotonate tautomerase family protein [Amycolatopsis sp. NPDC059657]|uniref:tautomerase family protein n=1 Tax=Amycolatopsis sp. NPDC059657 TaxID=3346899 RepID=UPI00367017E7